MTNIISVTILGAKYNIKAIHAARHDPQLKGLKFSSEMDITLKINKPEAPTTKVLKEGENPNSIKSDVSTEKV